jgi:hypothetical protein
MAEFSLNEKHQVLVGEVERRKSFLLKNKKLTLELERIRSKCISDVNSLVGSRHLRAYSNLHDEVRSKFLEPRVSFKSESEMQREDVEKRKSLVLKGQEMTDRLGVKDQVRVVFDDAAKKADAAFNRHLGSLGDAPFVVGDQSVVPAPDESPWLWFYPPYFSDFGEVYAYGSKGIHAATHSENRNTGRLATISYLEIKGASDSDYARTQARSEVMLEPLFVTTTGKIEAWLTLRNENASYHGRMDNEWGWSNINVKQQSHPYMSIYGRSGGYGSLFDFQKGDCDCAWSGKIAGANPGDLRFVHLISQDAFPANLWATLSFGLQDESYAWVNDYSVQMTMTNIWYLDSVAIRTGVP